jgi:phage-related protein
VTAPKTVEFRGSALSDLRDFPVAARREAGHQIDRVQHGHDPADWKPMASIGPGVCEIRVRDASGAFRIIYVTRFEDIIYLLHCFRKRTQKTRKADLDLAARRHHELVRDLDQ